MRQGLQEWVSNRSKGERYALALALNLGFVAIVIAGFAALYASGVNNAVRETGVVAASEGEPGPEFRITARRDDAADEDSLTGTSFADVDDEAADGVDAATDSAETSGEESGPDAEAIPLELADGGLDDAADAESGGVGAGLNDGDAPPIEPSGPAVEPASAEDAAADAGAPAGEEAAGGDAAEDTGEDDGADVAAAASSPSVSVAVGTDGGAGAASSIGAKWAQAGELAMSLEHDFPCARFLLSANARGEPRLQGRVARSDDLDAARARVDEAFPGDAEVGLGLGCTTQIGGGYVGLTDDRGRLSLFTAGELSAPMRAVLPREGACAVMGEVIMLAEPVRVRLSESAAPAAWVRARGEPALCEHDGEVWRIVPNADRDRRAGVILLGDDVLASDVRAAADIGPGDTSGAAARDAAARPPADEAAGDASGEAEALRQVVPLEGPAPRLPEGAPQTAEGYTVTVAFTVSEEGEAEDLTVLGAGLAPVSVVAAALDVIAESRFAPPDGEPYRAVHTVRFPSAEFTALLDRLADASAEPLRRDATPIWANTITRFDMDRVYPPRALERDISGEATLACTIQSNRRLECEVREETPDGWGFGAAALSLASRLRSEATMSDGGPSADADISLVFEFTPES